MNIESAIQRLRAEYLRGRAIPGKESGRRWALTASYHELVAVAEIGKTLLGGNHTGGALEALRRIIDPGHELTVQDLAKRLTEDGELSDNCAAGFIREAQRFYEEVQARVEAPDDGVVQESRDETTRLSEFIDKERYGLELSAWSRESRELSPTCKEQFEKVLKFIEQHFARGDREIVGGYTGQPNGCNQVPTLNICRRYRDRKKAEPNSWVVRVPLTRDWTIVLPEKVLRPEMKTPNKVNWTKHSFYPIDIDDFLKFPESYIDIEKNKLRLR
jgi:hypothetical protein